MKISALEKGGCLRILLLLKDGQTMFGRELGEHVHYQTLQRARDILKELGMIEITEDPVSQRLEHRLTQKGLDIAIRVGEIEELL